MSDDTVDELKERIQELEDELQQLKEKRKQEHPDSAVVDQEVEEVHDQIRDEADQSGMSRRKFMKAIAGGGAALGAAAMMPSAAALDIESDNPLSYNSNFEIDTQGNLNLRGKNIANAGSVGAETVSTEAVPTMYVRSDGDDSNDGRSAESAKATIAEAVSDAPVNGDGTSTLRIDVGSESLAPNDDLYTLYWDRRKVIIEGDTDGNGNPAATLDLTNTPTGFWLIARDAAVELRNISFTNVGRGVATAQKYGRVEAVNCVVDESFTDAAYDVRGGGSLNVGGEITQDTDKTNRALNIQEGYANITASITQTGSSDGAIIEIFDGSPRVDISPNAELVGLGSSTTTYLIHAQSPRHIKLGDCHLEGAEAVAALDAPVEFIAQNGLTNKTDVPNNFDRLNGGHINIGGSRPAVSSVSINNTGTAVDNVLSDLGVVNKRGAMFYHQDADNIFAYIVGDDYTPLPLAVRRRNGVQAGDLVQGEMAMDETNNRLVYKARGGTVHYWNTDGTL